MTQGTQSRSTRLRWASIGLALVVLITSLIVWIANVGDSDKQEGLRLVEALESTALPEGAYTIVVSPVDNDVWMTTIASLSKMARESLDDVSADALWVAYAETPADDGHRHRYDVVTVGFATPKQAEEVFYAELINKPDRRASQWAQWRHYGSTIQGVVSPPHDYLSEFPDDAPVLDMKVRNAAMRINVTDWADTLLAGSTDSERGYVKNFIAALGVSLDENSPSIILGSANSDDVMEGSVTGWQEARLEAVPSLITAAQEYECDETGESCIIHRSNLESLFYNNALGRVIGEGQIGRLTPIEREDSIPEDFLEHGNLVGYFHPMSIANGLTYGVSSFYPNDLRWLTFAFTTDGKVFIEPFFEALPEPVPAAPSDS